MTIYQVASATWEHMGMNLELYRQAVARHLPASGGELATVVGISLTVPPAATAAGADFVLNDIAAPTHKFADTQTPIRAFTVQAFDGANQPIAHFTQPLNIQVMYSDEDIQVRGLDENSINAAYWDGTTWNRILPSTAWTVDRAANRVTFTVSRLTEFALTSPAATQLQLFPQKHKGGSAGRLYAQRRHLVEVTPLFFAIGRSIPLPRATTPIAFPQCGGHVSYRRCGRTCDHRAHAGPLGGVGVTLDSRSLNTYATHTLTAVQVV